MEINAYTCPLVRFQMLLINSYLPVNTVRKRAKSERASERGSGDDQTIRMIDQLTGRPASRPTVQPTDWPAVRKPAKES